MDPTMQLLRDIEDPAKYLRVDNVPIFEAHEKFKTVIGPDGKPKKVKIKVTVGDLYEIAKNMNKLAREKGKLIRITQGHTIPDPDLPEQKQPAPVGYSKNLVVGRWGPGKHNIGILASNYYRRATAGETLETYPNVSAEYYDKAKQITGVAHLRRDAELDLGMIAYGAETGIRYYYAMEKTMPPDPTLAPDAAIDPNEPIPDIPAEPSHEEKIEQFMRHCHSHPYARYMSDHYGMDAAPLGGPGMPGASDVSIPGAGRLDRDVENLEESQAAVRMNRDSNRIRYARLEAEVKVLREETNKARYGRELAKAEAGLIQLEAEGFLLPNKVKLLDRLAKLDDAGREEEMNEIRTAYQRDPAAMPMIRSLRQNVEGGATKSAGPTKAEHKAAIRYASEKSVGYNAALKAIRSNAEEEAEAEAV